MSQFLASVVMGIIPAGAGKSNPAVITTITKRDHPRGCGEKFAEGVYVASGKGSSPRVRGKAPTTESAGPRSGIIPAGAGKRRRLRCGRRRTGDHPRGCGEKTGSNRAQASSYGSSPRVRGKAGRAPLERGVRRIIPAGAGKS